MVDAHAINKRIFYSYESKTILIEGTFCLDIINAYHSLSIYVLFSNGCMGTRQTYLTASGETVTGVETIMNLKTKLLLITMNKVFSSITAFILVSFIQLVLVSYAYRSRIIRVSFSYHTCIVLVSYVYDTRTQTNNADINTSANHNWERRAFLKKDDLA